MKPFTLMVAASLLVLSVNQAFAQPRDVTHPEDGPITIGKALTLTSQELGEERKILVSLPGDYQTSSKRYPVIYLLDAQYFFQFQYAYGVISALAFMEEIPEVILVGIHHEAREIDLTTADSPYRGHADKFLSFIRNELQGFIDQQYRTQPYSMLIGHSAGGFFGVYTLLEAPDTFNGYVVLDPALQTDGGIMLDAFSAALADGKTFSNTLFTASVATRDAVDDSEVSVYELLDAITQYRPEGLQFSHQAYPAEDHTSITMPGIEDGIRALYADWKPPASVDSLADLLAHYESLSQHYGYRVAVPVTHASDLGFRLISQGDAEEALEVFEYRLANISDDAIAHYSVGFALRQLGRLDEALASFETAVELGEGMDMYTAFVRFRDEVAQEIRARDATAE